MHILILFPYIYTFCQDTTKAIRFHKGHENDKQVPGMSQGWVHKHPWLLETGGNARQSITDFKKGHTSDQSCQCIIWQASNTRTQGRSHF